MSTCVLAALTLAGSAVSSFAQDHVKVAFWNVMSGKGVDALPGHAATFTNTSNCTDPAQPLNAWGVGAMQAQLAQLAGDPSVVALGLAEAWGSVCGSGEHIRQFLGWTAKTAEQNGVSLVARYGFAGPEQWQQLDTSLNTSPSDTMWIVRAPVCLDAACSKSMPVYVAHWYGTGTNGATTYQTQAQQTVAFLNATAGNEPHIFVGDLNVWEGTAGVKVCNQSPTNSALPYLRSAGYFDAWVTLRGAEEGSTGMINRAGCGYPEGNAWKRIDYAWTKGAFQPTAIQRFAQVPVGDASPSDHYGIIVTLPNPYPATPTTTTPPAPAPAPAPQPAPAAMWTSVVKSSANGATLQKTSGCSSCFDAGAIGTQPVGPGGSIKFSVAAGQRLFAGLSTDQTASTSYAAIDYAFSFWPSGTFEIREKNVYRKEGTFAATDVFTVSVEGPAVKYYKNGTLVYSSATPVSGTLVFDTSLSSIGATVTNLSEPVVAAPAPAPAPAVASTDVVWTSLVKATAAGNALQKTSGCDGCFDAGAISQQQITGDGSFTFTVAAGQRLFAGLGRDTSASTGYATIDYAFSFWPTGTFEIRENNVYKKEGVSAPGDVFSVAVESGLVKYYRNGALVYTSKTAVSGPLVADTSISTPGATIAGSTIK